MSSASPSYDVAIAGAGPAGCAAAIVLHRAGLRVCLLDDAAPDTPKVGESLPGAARRLLHQLGIAGLESLLAPADYHACAANASAWGSSHWVYQSALLNPEGGGWHLNRAAFDEALRQYAQRLGIRRYMARIAELTSPPAGSPDAYALELSTAVPPAPATLRATWVIDATGRRAYVSRRLHVAREKLDTQMAAVCWLPAAAPDQDCTTRIKSVASGWWYTARLPAGRRVVCFHGLPAATAAHLKDPAAFLREFNEAGLLPYPVSQAGMTELRGTDASVARLAAVATARVLAVGDAALAFDPLSSQGIFFALYSGIKAAEAIGSCHTQPARQPAALAGYQAQIDRVFEANQRSRRHFYASEFRYAAEPYWQARRAALALV